ncbi:glycoside hydrolase family 15 protein [Puniceicoccus vermicola]|uniref:Glycoside hydrolase family 15 protein n=2 Tax=Puniceicoccus vermicola TaxID=388746 RepID=A0A7X1B283_9BACT|nr:glycoside hydrolase family 15 protein [Puniceicoccus vermicola]
MNLEDYPLIEEYGIIGDLSTVALVGPGARIDFLCLPEFDSPSVFAAHVDREKGGCFSITPKFSEVTEKKIYFPETNILLSRFLSKEGIAEVTDLMVVHEKESNQALVRRAKAVHGAVEFEMRCSPRFDYARIEHRVETLRDGCSFHTDDLSLRFRSDVPVEIDGQDVVARFKLEAGETATFVLESAECEERPETVTVFCSRAFKETATFWRKWLSRCSYKGRWRETVQRSALALKLLTSRRHGSVVAAPSFGFPNFPGGERNWDYRYTWLRDAAFTTYAFMRLGFTEEAAGFMGWLEKRVESLEEGSHLNVMYRIDGSPVEGEFALDHLEGYRKSKPIRIGSTNNDQFQLDIYGELMDSLYLFDKFGSPVSYQLWNQICKLVDFVADHWREPDMGIWEIRDGKREFLYSRVMSWVALDRGVRLALKRSRPAPLERWIKERDAAYNSVFEEFWSEEKQSFVQFKGTDALDASALIMPLVRFISPTDPKWLSTLEAIRRELTEDSLVYRYRVNEAFDEHLEGEDGTFSICSFWYIECLSRGGNTLQARHYFEKMLSYSSPLGLFSEQIGSEGQSLGNMPQAFTHLSLISAAFELDRRLGEGSGDDVGFTGAAPQR